MVTLSFKIERFDIPKISELLSREGIKKLEIIEENNENLDQLPKEIIEMIDIGIDQANAGDMVESTIVHQKARKLCRIK